MTYLDVMDLWACPQEMADDLGVKLTRVQKWRTRRMIPPGSLPAVLNAAKRRGFPISAEALLSVKSAPRSEHRVGA